MRNRSDILNAIAHSGAPEHKIAKALARATGHRNLADVPADRLEDAFAAVKHINDNADDRTARQVEKLKRNGLTIDPVAIFKKFNSRSEYED